MSVCVTIRTKKELEPKQIFDALVKRGEAIMVTSDSFPCLKLGRMHQALRGIEINQEDNGYEVRICSLANRSDHELYGVTIDTLMKLTKDHAFFEDEDENEVTNPLSEFGKEWIDRELESGFNVNCALMKGYGKPVIMYGLFHEFCFGPVLANSFHVNLYSNSTEGMDEMLDYLTDMQWTFADKEDTSTRLALANPHGEAEKSLSVSLIAAKNKQVKDFDLISYADVVALMDEEKDGNEIVMIHMSDLKNILPQKKFFMIDDYQFAKEGKLSYKAFKEMQQQARLYQVDDLHYRPTFPGSGYDEHQNTYILMWNPAISNVKMENHVSSIHSFLLEHYSWSVYEYEEAKKNDRFVMVRVGEGKTGVVMSGIFDSNPYQAGDWSGKGREVYYMNMQPNFIADPDNAPLISTSELQSAIPDFDWTGGHSGRKLNKEQSVILDKLLGKYFGRIVNLIDGKTINGIEMFTYGSMEDEDTNQETQKKNTERKKRLDLDLIFNGIDNAVIVLKNGKGGDVVDEKGTPITATYVGGGKFKCRGEIGRTSPLAKKYLNLYAGMNLTTVNGNDYWYYNGQKLSALRKN